MVFHDVSFIEVKPHVRGGTGFQPVKHGQDAHATCTVAVELTGFSVFYSQDSIKAARLRGLTYDQFRYYHRSILMKRKAG